MRNLALPLLLISLLSICHAQSNDVQGAWIIKSGRLANNYEMADPYSVNRVIFSDNDVDLASGFFYNTVDIDTEYPQGRYPYMYYGNLEKYKVKGDSLYIYSNPYKTWASFWINHINEESLVLIGESDTVFLERSETIIDKKTLPCEIRYIRAHVYDGPLGLFQLDYKVVYSDDDNLVYEGPDYFKKTTIMHIKLDDGGFENICNAFKFVDLTRIRRLYTTEISEYGTIDLEIGTLDGRTIRSEIRNLNCPDELRLALIPILFVHQRYVYPYLKPVK